MFGCPVVGPMLGCGFPGNCSSHVGDFYYLAFNISGRAYEVSPINYLKDTLDASNQPYCKILIQSFPNNFNSFFFGDLFMQQYYLMLDYDLNRFAINGNWTPLTRMNTKKYGEPSDPIPPPPIPPGPAPPGPAPPGPAPPGPPAPP